MPPRLIESCGEHLADGAVSQGLKVMIGGALDAEQLAHLVGVRAEVVHDVVQMLPAL